MGKRKLGRTGYHSTVVTFGAISLDKKEDTQEDAAEWFTPLSGKEQEVVVESQRPPNPERRLGILPAT